MLLHSPEIIHKETLGLAPSKPQYMKDRIASLVSIDKFHLCPLDCPSSSGHDNKLRVFLPEVCLLLDDNRYGTSDKKY